MRLMRNAHKILENLKNKDYFEDIAVDEMILEWILGK
jgi:hypothetical protein